MNGSVKSSTRPSSQCLVCRQKRSARRQIVSHYLFSHCHYHHHYQADIDISAHIDYIISSSIPWRRSSSELTQSFKEIRCEGAHLMYYKYFYKTHVSTDGQDFKGLPDIAYKVLNSDDWNDIFNINWKYPFSIKSSI